MIVVDASAAVSALLRAGAARDALAEQQVHVPHLIDAEVASALRRRATDVRVGAEVAAGLLRTWQRLAMTRYPVFSLLDRVWALRENVSAYDASCIALAEALDCTVLTADARLARAPGPRCPITLVP